MTPARLRTLAARWFSDNTMARLVEPTLADFAFEREQARDAASVHRTRVWLTGQWAFWKVFARIAAAQTWRSAHDAGAWRDIGRVAVTTGIVAIAFGVVFEAFAFLRWMQLFGVPLPRVLVITLVPRVVPLTCPVALALVILWRRATRPIRARTVFAVSIAGSLLTLVMLGWGIPAATRAAGIPDSRTIGDPILSLVHAMRWAMGAAPIVLALFASAISAGPDRRRVLSRLVGTIAALGYPFALALAMQLGVQGRLPVLAAAWGPDATFVALAVVTLLLTYRRRVVDISPKPASL